VNFTGELETHLTVRLAEPRDVEGLRARVATFSTD
jgi:hypothetical protein